MKKIVQFLKTELWKIRIANEPLKRRLWLRPLRIGLMTLREFGRDKCSLQASALTFYTLLSLVPVLALAFGIAKGFGMHEMLETKVRALASGESIVQIHEQNPSDAPVVVAPDGEITVSENTEVESLTEGQAKVVDQAITFASNMLENAKGGVVAGLGVAILLWTVIKLLGNIEKSFNDIWHVHTGRSWARKFSDYLSVMLVSPVLFLASTSVTAYIASQFLSVVDSNSMLSILSGPARIIVLAVPTLLFGLLFTFIYLFMPNTKVRPMSAFCGGLFAGILYQVTQIAFVRFQVGISSANAIYGTFAALPLFLSWLQLSWMIVLLGAEFAYSHQYSDITEFEEDQRAVSTHFKRLSALCLVRECVQDFAQSQPAATAEELSKRLGIPMSVTSDILAELVECGVLSGVIKKGPVSGFQPALDIENLRISNIIISMDKNGREDYQLTEKPEHLQLEDILESFRQHINSSDKNIALKELAK